MRRDAGRAALLQQPVTDVNILFEMAKKEFIRVAKENGKTFTKEQIRDQAMLTPAMITFALSENHKPKPLMPRRVRRELLQLISVEQPIENLPECARIAYQAQCPETHWR